MGKSLNSYLWYQYDSIKLIQLGIYRLFILRQFDSLMLDRIILLEFWLLETNISKKYDYSSKLNNWSISIESRKREFIQKSRG